MSYKASSTRTSSCQTVSVRQVNRDHPSYAGPCHPPWPPWSFGNDHKIAGPASVLCNISWKDQYHRCVRSERIRQFECGCAQRCRYGRQIKKYRLRSRVINHTQQRHRIFSSRHINVGPLVHIRAIAPPAAFTRDYSMALLAFSHSHSESLNCPYCRT